MPISTKGPIQFFEGLPPPLRLIMPALIRRKVKKTMELQGFGRHTRAERDKLAILDIDALAAVLGEKPFLMGGQPCGADATVFSFVAHLSAPIFASAARTRGTTPKSRRLS